jgi:DNA-binding XRE family transcriptional regulator
MKKNLLKSYIVRYDGNQENLAKAMGISLSTLNAKINENRQSFSVKEMKFLKDRYNLSNDEFITIFFTD